MELIRCQGARESRAPRRIIDLPDPFDDTEGGQIRRMAEYRRAGRLVGTPHPASPGARPQLPQSDTLPRTLRKLRGARCGYRLGVMSLAMRSCRIWHSVQRLAVG